MDVLLLEAIIDRNPFLAKHGMVLNVWQEVARRVGNHIYSDPHAFAWHQCR